MSTCFYLHFLEISPGGLYCDKRLPDDKPQKKEKKKKPPGHSGHEYLKSSVCLCRGSSPESHRGDLRPSCHHFLC